ncbi:MAG: T9SS type A sorting domain-containing protein [Candidatus Marinimicrobia bacterium]|nr:T9SS type A sorting domain-containing protein [Candidatus Neomarinimicrobiota bacterium]
MKRVFLTMLFIVVMITNTFGQNEITGDITSNQTWYADQDYLLTGQTFVEAGVTLTIEPGTVIKANQDDGTGLAPALVIKRGGILIANGTKNAPITFTSSLPDSSLPARGTWGGLIILGAAPTNKGTSFVEGLAGIPYGGDNPADSSGILRYVRVWYGGRSIGQDNEINGITFAGVGNKTVVEYCEVAYNLDDGFEFFGGTVNVKYLSALFVGDDAFDTDEGYQGKGQFLFTIQGTDMCGRGFEMDNSGSNMDLQPRSYPQFSNATIIGPNGGTPTNDGSDELIRLREGTGGDFRNMLLAYGNGVGLRVKDGATQALIPDSISFTSNSVIYDCATAQFHSDIISDFTAKNINPEFRHLEGRQNSGMIDPRPAIGSSLLDSAVALENDGFFTQVDFIGAFGNEQWLESWSILDEQGRLGTATAIENNNISLATSFELSSYPNPFNPTTNINFFVPKTQNVKIMIYNLKGEKMLTLLNQEMEMGDHAITFDGSNFSSGIYFVKLETSNNIIAKSITLLK